MTLPGATKFVIVIAALGAMLFSSITAQAQSDIVGAWKVRSSTS
jgi:hypothetical protein